MRSNLDGSNVEQIHSVEIKHFTFREQYPSSEIALHIPRPTFISISGNALAVPTTSGLEPNYPNPFNARTQIFYRLAASAPVRLDIYNILGQPVRTLVDEFRPMGAYHAQWDARDGHGVQVAAGVYFARLQYPGGVKTRRLLLLK